MFRKVGSVDCSPSCIRRVVVSWVKLQKGAVQLRKPEWKERLVVVACCVISNASNFKLMCRGASHIGGIATVYLYMERCTDMDGSKSLRDGHDT